MSRPRNNDNPFTTMKVLKSTLDFLKTKGRKGDSYDDIILKAKWGK